MANRKLYCRILDYLEKESPQLATVFHNLCAEGFLSPRRKPGVTLLVPEDKKIIDSLVNESSSGDLEKMNKALEQLGALVIPFNLPSAGSVTSDMSNSMGFTLGASAAGDNIKFPNGAVASKDNVFAQFKKDPFLHVYKLKGEIPVSTTKADVKNVMKKQMDEKKKVKDTLKKKTGSGNDISYDGAFDLGVITATEQIIRAGNVIRIEDKAAADRSLDIMCACAANLLDLVKSENAELYNELCCLLTGRAIDLYILIEPFKNKEGRDKFLVDQNIINKFDEMCSKGELAKKSRNDLIAHMGNAKAGCANLHTEANKIRQGLLDSQKLENFKNKVSEVYKDFYTGSAVQSVFSGESRVGRIYKENPIDKLHDDEFRFRGSLLLDQMEERWDDEIFTAFKNLAADCMSGASLFERANLEAIFSGENIMYAKFFFASSAFLYIAIPNNKELDTKSRTSFGVASEAANSIYDIRGATARTGALKKI